MAGFAKMVTFCAAMMFLCAGGCASVRLRFLQLRGLGKAVRQVFGRSKEENGEGISSFEASSAALAGAVGTGNIAGVAGAIALGGPGAVFWMWVSAILGMATKYAEIFLAVKYRDGRMGGWLRNSGKHLFPLFCLFGASAAMGVGALVQSSTLAEAVAESAGDSPLWLRPVLGISAAVITGMVVSGGAKGVGKLSALLMPLMGGLYVLGAVYIILQNLSGIPKMLEEIFASAFGLRSAAGGAWFSAVRYGVERGVFSHEAGLGSGALAHEWSREKEPEKEALWGIFEVFADTVVMCSLTAFAVLLTGEKTAIGAFSSVLGNGGGLLVAGCSVFFALSSLFPWCIYGKQCFTGLTGGKGKGYTAAYLLCIAAAPFLPPESLWQWAGILNACMAAPNLLAVLRHMRRGNVA